MECQGGGGAVVLCGSTSFGTQKHSLPPFRSRVLITRSLVHTNCGSPNAVKEHGRGGATLSHRFTHSACRPDTPPAAPGPTRRFVHAPPSPQARYDSARTPGYRWTRPIVQPTRTLTPQSSDQVAARQSPVYRRVPLAKARQAHAYPLNSALPFCLCAQLQRPR